MLGKINQSSEENMKARHLISTWVSIGICLCFLVQRQTAAGGLQQQDHPGDSVKSRSSPTLAPKKNSTFKLLPKFDEKKDTAGFKLIPLHKDDPDFVPYDKEPQIIRKVEPAYPEPAKRAGLEGRVIVKMLVDTAGKVGQVVVLKSDAEVFNEPAIEAAKQFVFTPATVNNKPVAVWISYPFRFRLQDKK
jgi:TonB family protein